MSVSGALGAARHTRIAGGSVVIQPRAGVVFQPGSAVCHRVGSNLAETPLSATPRTDLVTLGTFIGNAQFTASSTADSAGGALDTSVNPAGVAQSITLAPFGPTGWFATGTSTNAVTAVNIDQPCYWYDDDTVYLTDVNGTLSFAGFVDDVNASTGRVMLRSNESTRPLFELFSPGQLGAAGTLSLDARCVATNVPLNAGAGTGVLTASATGAWSSQDGVTLALGNIILVPAGTLTTAVIAAADAGPYQVTTLGATGVKMVLTRPASWAHGGIINVSSVRVGAEGTLFSNTVWRAAPATATKVVGTDDPSLYPDRVTQSVTLGGGSPIGKATVTNVPLRSATKTNYIIRRSGAGTTATLTLEYAPFNITPGALGTATVEITAAVAAGTINTADGSTLFVTVVN